ncbi:DUF7519 family protein [Haloarchaeobius iranensis]|uniref:Uncharacterized protein n=1 Tax=Haloarchaeobius iranensis TaxID=996166 RepID=A0A1G9UC76_9EURY|nr:hypothetical protein [Haloarchaeobius iranensis]SDM57577.1 hypothetical protein SAMN05192554_10454 [Haloarchaeobius iranensis]
MTPYEFDDEPARFSSRLALAVAAVAALLLGLGTGPGLLGQAPELLLGLLGTGALVRGATGVSEDESRQRAVGSVWFVFGVLGVGGAIVAYKPSLAAAAVTTFGTLAVLLLGLSLTVGIDEGLVRSLGGALSRSLVVVVAGTVLLAGVHVALFRSAAVLTVAGYGALVGAGPLVGFLMLQVEVLVLAVVVERALAVVDGWLPRRRFDSRETALRQFGVRAGDVPKGVYVLLGLQFVLATTGTGRALFTRLLVQTGPFGTVVGWFLQSWVPHALLGAAILLFGSVLVARLCQLAVVRWVGREPPKTLGYAAGGAVVSVLVGVLTALPPVTWLVDWSVTDGSTLDIAFATYGMGTTFLALVVMALCAVLVSLPVFMFVVWDEATAPAENGSTAGAGLLLLSAIAAGFGGAPAAVVFIGVAAALATWDLSVNASLVGNEVGRDAETRRGEVIHAAGVLAVGAATVLVTLLGVEFIGAAALAVDVPRWRAVGALALLLLALVCFAALASGGDGASDGEDGDGPDQHVDRGPWYTQFDDL